MGLLAHVLRLSGLSHDRPPSSFRPSLGDVVPMVPDHVRSPRVLGKRALSLVNQTILLAVKMLSASSDLE
jgi:hypothetical protein